MSCQYPFHRASQDAPARAFVLAPNLEELEPRLMRAALIYGQAKADREAVKVTVQP